MTKKNQIETLASKLNCSKVDALNILEAYQSIMVEEITNTGQFHLPGIGNFKVKTRNARTGRNPRTGDSIQIPERNVVQFKASNSLSQLINLDRQQIGT